MKREITIKMYIMGGKQGFGVFMFDSKTNQDLIIGWFRTLKEAEEYKAKKDAQKSLVQATIAPSTPNSLTPLE